MESWASDRKTPEELRRAISACEALLASLRRSEDPARVRVLIKQIESDLSWARAQLAQAATRESE